MIAPQPQSMTAGVVDDGRNLQAVVADRSLRIDAKHLTQIGRHLAGFLIAGIEIAGIVQGILTDLKLDMRVITGSIVAASTAPRPVIPGHRLHRCHCSVCQFSDPKVQASLTVDMIPVIGILVLA